MQDLALSSSNFFWTTNIFEPKSFLEPNFLGIQIFFRPKICKTILTQKFFGPKNFFRAQIFWTKNFFDPNLFNPNIFCTQHLLDPIFLWNQNFFGPKFFSIKNIVLPILFTIFFDIKLFCCPSHFLTQIFFDPKLF